MFKTIDKVGIAIDREARTVRPGFTYRQRFIWLRKINESGSVETVRDWGGYQYLIKLGKGGDVLKGARVVMRVGGEGRQAIVELVSASEDIPRAETGGGVTYGVVLSPVVFDGDAPFINVEQVDKDIELVYGLLSEGGVRQRVMTASLGFSEAAKCRRPIYPAMLRVPWLG
ncbi:type III-B CRISPR module-associated Cmr3 family protein [Vulcanisaeta distributa]|uniref:type III-B CRISPR module-associated Cmr3 family protein n=1 Tax=Vulcanisaeta distributa TaxID=164451 RepID=UPI0006D02209|nr:type III-B CRISPR module-associated Cmr3 family protein [Vulcanisaeta distributa]